MPTPFQNLFNEPQNNAYQTPDFNHEIRAGRQAGISASRYYVAPHGLAGGDRAAAAMIGKRDNRVRLSP